MKYWLIKTEPDTYGWEDLLAEENKTTTWEGIRNYQARNYIRDEIKHGDFAFFYHSVVKPAEIVGIVNIISDGYVDHFAFDSSHNYFDPKSKQDNPRWFMMDVQAYEQFESSITIDELKEIPELSQMVLLNNTRLSVQPVTNAEWMIINNLRSKKKVKI